MVRAVYDYILARDDLGHIFTASTTMLAVFLVIGLLVRGRRPLNFAEICMPAVAVLFRFYGREKAQFEIALKNDLGMHSVIPLWYRGYWPGEWSRDGLQDFLVPVIFAWTITALVLLVVWRRRSRSRTGAGAR